MTIARGVDERMHADAIKALVNPAIAPWSVLDYDEVPGTNNQGNGLPNTEPPPMFMELSIFRIAATVERASGRTTASGWRIQLRSVATTVDECRHLVARSTAALETRLVVDGHTSTPIKAGPTDPAEWDEGRYSALAEWTYAL